MKPLVVFICLISSCIYLTGCGSVAKGVTEAILEHESPEDNRTCEIRGNEFDGLHQSLDTQKTTPKTTKILMVHGISKHLPGYSTRFKEKLTTQLNLDVTTKDYKEIEIVHEKILNTETNEMEPLGILRISRHTNEAEDKELLFYELTWSQITDPERAQLEFDNTGELAPQRAAVNQSIKTMFNSTIVDLMTYRGTSRDSINAAVGQSVCWAFSGQWNDLPDRKAKFCNTRKPGFASNTYDDDYFFVTHSLGSHIIIETLSGITDMKTKNENAMSANAQKLFKNLQDKNITVFMLSNQLPLLNLGQVKPAVTDEGRTYCRPGASHYNERIFKQLSVIGFNDPNDILSYPLSSRYIEDRVDSRLCPEVVNINLNVVDVQSTFGIEFANPASAHVGYHEDDKVIELISNGLSRHGRSPMIHDKCRWIQTKD